MPAWSGFWNQVYGENYSQIDSEHFRRQLRISMRNFRIPYNRVISALVQNGVGVAYGDYKRVAAQDINDPFGTLGGKRPYEIRVVINRAITRSPTDPNTDEGRVRADLYNQKWATPMSPTGRQWAVDKSGNGSGGLAGSKGL